MTEYLPGLRATRTEEDVPFEAPLTEKAQLPPMATATSVPLAPPDVGGGGVEVGGGGVGGVAVFEPFLVEPPATGAAVAGGSGTPD